MMVIHIIKLTFELSTKSSQDKTQYLSSNRLKHTINKIWLVVSCRLVVKLFAAHCLHIRLLQAPLASLLTTSTGAGNPLLTAELKINLQDKSLLRED